MSELIRMRLLVNHFRFGKFLGLYELTRQLYIKYLYTCIIHTPFDPAYVYIVVFLADSQMY